MSKPLTIVIPVRGESENITDTVQTLTTEVLTPHDILVVDDHVSRDDLTVPTVVRLQKTYQNIRVLKKNRGDADGFGPALCRSVAEIKTPYAVFVMGDLCDEATTIDTMVRKANQTQTDVVAGCRYMRGGKKVGGPLLQHVASTFLNRSLHMLGMPTRDATNAFKLYRTAFLRSILPKKPLTGVEFTLQLSIAGYRHHGIYVDVPTRWTGRTKGKSKLRIVRSGCRYLRLTLDFLSAQFTVY